MDAAVIIGSCILGIGLGTCLGPPSFGMCCAMLGGIRLASRDLRVLAVALSLLFGTAYVHAWRSSRKPDAVKPGAYRFTGTVVANPDQRQYNTLLTLRLDKPLHPGSHGPPGNILVRARKSSSWKYGDELEVIGTVKPAERFSNFDYPLYLERYGMYGICTPKRVVVLSRGNGNRLLAGLYRLQAGLEKQAYGYVPPIEAALLNGILLGAKRSLPEGLQEDLRHTGTSHIVVISGANITILIALVVRFMPVYTRRARYACTVLVAGWLTLMTGASASVIRGAIVSWIGVHAAINNRRARPVTLFLLLGLIMLLWNPLMLVADPSFQLSMGAFAGLLFLGRPITQMVNSTPILKRLPAIMRSSLAETLAATSTTFPISWWLFGQVSLLGLVVNPLVLWLLPSITLLGSLIIVMPIAAFDRMVSLPLHWLLWSVLLIIERFGRVPWGVIAR